MKFFIAVYPGDARFHNLLDTRFYNYGYLCSVAYYTLSSFKRQISGFKGEVMIDSGGYREINNPTPSRTQKEVFFKQMEFSKLCKEAILVHYDFPVNYNLSKKENDERIEITLENASQFKDLCLRYNLGCKTLAVIQGYDLKSLTYCITELKKIGFDIYGLGGVAKLVQTASGKWLDVLRMIYKVKSMLAGKPLHVFGVNNLNIIKRLSSEIYSLDSSSPTKGAFCSRIFINGIQKDLRKMEISSWNCRCPACLKYGDQVLMRGKKYYNNCRAIHNLHDLLSTLGLVKKG